MKFHIAFVLLAIFGAAQAGKKNEVMTFGTGYKDNDRDQHDMEDTLNYGDMEGATSSYIMDRSTENAEQAMDTYGMKSEAHSSSAEMFIELLREKRQTAVEYHKRAENQAVAANEAYKKAQLHKRQAKDKEVIAKEYEERAQKHDRNSKQQDMKEQDDIRKETAEHGEYLNNLMRANTAAVYSNGYTGMSQLEMDETNECEQHAKAMLAKAEEYEKLAYELKEKAKKEKENARIQESKGKEDETKASEYETYFIESSKKVNTLKYYELEFHMKGEHERHQAEFARIRAKYLGLLANYNKDQSEALHRFANMEDKDSLSFHRQSIEYYKQTKVLTATAAHLMKSHRYTGHQMYSKEPFPHSNLH